jgi:hypothetical protein
MVLESRTVVSLRTHRLTRGFWTLDELMMFFYLDLGAGCTGEISL